MINGASDLAGQRPATQAAAAASLGPVDRDMLIDVSRLVWRWWRGSLPTGVDRVCLAYVEHFRKRARAVVQRRGRYFILSGAHSDQLFDLFTRGPGRFRVRVATLAAGAFFASNREPLRRGLLYLNVGHTGLDEPSLPRWVEQNQLRAIYFIHDLIPLQHPEYCRPGEMDRHARRIENVLASASGVIGNSQATLNDLEAFATARGLPMSSAVASFIAGPSVPADLAPSMLDQAYFITVGTIEGRKNHLLLLRIWERLKRRYGRDTPILLIVGQRGWEAADAQAILDRSDSLKEQVRELGTCTDKELANLIAGARALLMPSYAEGFGLPVAEALQLGTPVIASDLPVFREFAGDIPKYVDVLDGLGWERAIIGFVGESAERERQLEALRKFRAPEWQSHFMVVDEWLRTLRENH